MCVVMTWKSNPSTLGCFTSAVSSAPLLPGGVVCAGPCCRGARSFFDGSSVGEVNSNDTVLREDV